VNPGGPILPALADQMAELAAILAPLDDAGWAAPSRCPGWSVSDVVLHLAQTNEMAVGSLQDRIDEVVTGLTAGVATAPTADVDEGAALMVEAGRGAPGAEVLDRWQAGVDALAAELAAADPSARVRWVAGELSARTLATTRLTETWIHTGDVTWAFGEEPERTDRLWHIARLSWRTLPYAFTRAGRARPGPVTFTLRSPGGDTWVFEPDDAPPADDPALTSLEGEALDLCLVAGQRAAAADTSLTATGPDADAVLELVRTFA
jgi:uncharacterized protein (TIGR03084 family)